MDSNDKCSCQKRITSIGGWFRVADVSIITFYPRQKDATGFTNAGAARYYSFIRQPEQIKAINCCICSKIIFSLVQMCEMRDVLTFSLDFNRDLIKYIVSLHPETKVDPCTLLR